jgi:hypothetical protein
MSGPNGPQWGQPGGQQGPEWQPGQQPQQWGPRTGNQPTQQFGPGTGAQPGQPQQGQPNWGPQPGGQPPQGQPNWGPQPGGQPPQGQPNWGPQPGGQPTGGQPTQGWGAQAGSPQQWGQPTAAQPTQGWDPQTGGQPGQPWAPQYGPPGVNGQPPNKSNKGVIITAIAVVVALVAGLGVWFFAFRDSKPAGKETPQQAAAQLFADIDNGDLIGLADTFDPVEASFVNDLAGDVLAHFKRLGLLTDSATVGDATGASISIKGITFDDAAAEKPLADLTIVKLTGGTITITPSTSSNESDLFARLKDALGKYAQSSGVSADVSTAPTVIDIAKVIKDDNDGKPIRISTVLRDGSWYPSLFYTIADYWAQASNLGAVTADDAIAADGAANPEAAVNSLLDALMKQDATALIKILPPGEMAAVHAYGKKIVTAIGSGTADTSGVDIKGEWVTSDVTGGTLVSVKTLDVTVDGKTIHIAIDKDAGTLTVVDAEGKSQTIDANSIGELIDTDLSEVHPNLPDFVGRMLKAALGLGILTTQADGKWYVSPARSFTGVFTTLLGGVEQQDIEMFIELLNK